MNIYDFSAQNVYGDEISLGTYEGKVLLIVNSATECGFTPQYDDLQDLYEKYGDQGFDVLEFPCDQFGHQAPGSDEEIASFCDARFGLTFSRIFQGGCQRQRSVTTVSISEKPERFCGI